MKATMLGPALAAGALALLDARAAGATDLQLTTGVLGAGSAWRGDAAVAAHLQFGARFEDLVGPYARVEEGYASVDERLFTALSLGVQLWLRVDEARPYFRLGLLHQHEEPVGFVEHEPASALVGVGDGIRHRTGGELAVGCEYPVYVDGDFHVFAGADAFARLFPDSVGPIVYGGAGARFGFDYAL